jgi:hypothetical protein
MGWVAELAVGRRTGEGWRGMRGGGKGAAGGDSVADTQTWQNQTLRVRNTCAYWGLFRLPSSLTKVSDEPQRQVVAGCGDDGSGQSWG